MKYKCNFKINEHDKANGKVFVLKSYKRFLDASKFFELSGQRFICPEHGFQHDVVSDINSYDVFNGAKDFVHKCSICGSICTIEKATKFEIREYVDVEWKSRAQEQGLTIIPFEQVEVIQKC